MASLDLPDIPIGSYEQYAADQFRALTQPVLDRLQMAPNPAIEAIRNQVDPSNRIFVDQAVGAAQRAGIDPVTYIRQINAESGFNPNAGSNEGAKGIAQFTDATAKGYGIDPYNPGQALDAGARYMATALATNHGDYRLALASYNAGQGNVDRYGQNIFNPAYLKAQGWSDEDANQPARYIASILGGGAAPTTPPTPASLVQGAGAALGTAAGQIAQVPHQAVQSFKDYSAGLLHQFSQSLAPPASQQPSYNAMAGADSSRPSDLPTPPDAPQTPDLGGSSFHDWSNNLIGQLAQTSSAPPAASSSPGAAVAGAAGGDVAASSPALSSPSPGYNDMVGASSTPQPTMPTPATGGTPPATPAPSFADWSTNLINQLGQAASNAPGAVLGSVGTAAGAVLHELPRPRQLADLGLPNLTGPQGSPGTKLAAYYQQTDPSLPANVRLGQALDLAQKDQDRTFQTGATLDPTGGLATGLAQTATHLTDPTMLVAPEIGRGATIGTGVGALGGLGVARATGADPSQTAASMETGANVGMLAGGGVEALAHATPAIAGAVRNAAPGVLDAAQAALRAPYDAGIRPGLSVADTTGGDVTRMYHGTGSAFTTPDGAKFDPNGLFGPGYYLTSDARVASSYGDKRAVLNPSGDAQELLNAAQTAKDAAVQAVVDGRNAGVSDHRLALLQGRATETQQNLDGLRESLGPQGSNLRAVNVPNGLNLLNADAPVPQTQYQQIIAGVNTLLGPAEGRSLDTSLRFQGYGYETGQRPLNGEALVNTLKSTVRDVAQNGDAIQRSRTSGDPSRVVNQILARSGVDGISYAGGNRVPLADDAGQPIQHQAVVIFPESLPKLTNAISGTPMGSPPAVGGAVLGGVYGATQGDTPQERAKNAALGALGGGLAGHVLGGGHLPVGMSIQSTVADLPKSTAHVINELLAPAKNAPADVQTALRDFANRNLQAAVDAETWGMQARVNAGKADNATMAARFETTGLTHANPTPAQTAFSNDVKNMTEATRAEGTAHGYINGDVTADPNGPIKAYFPHVYQDNLTRATAQSTKAGLSPSDFYSNSRVFPTLNDAVAAGFKPVDSFSGPLQHYVQRIGSSEAKYQLVADLKNASPAAVVDLPQGGKVPDGFVPGAAVSPQFTGVAFQEDVAKAVKNILNPSAVRSTALGRAFLGAQSVGKEVLFTLTGFHQLTELRQAVSAGGIKAVPIVAKSVTNAFLPGAFEKLRLGEADGFSQAARSGVTGLTGDTLALDAGDRLSPGKAMAVRSLTGAVAGGASGYAQAKGAGADDQTALEHGLVGAGIGALAGPAGKLVSDSLWTRQVPTLKYLTWKLQVASGRDPQAAASFVNNTYGGQNLAAIARSKTVQDALRTATLAPDWWESFANQIGNAFKGGDAGGQARAFWARTAVASAFTLEGLNYALNGHFTDQNDPDHRFELDLKGLYDRLGVTQRNPKTGVPESTYMNVLPGPILSLLDLSSGNLGKFAMGRFATLPRVAAQAMSNRDYRGQEIVPPYTPLPEAIARQGANAVSQIAPIGGQQIQYSGTNNEPAGLTAFSTATGLRTAHPSAMPANGPLLSSGTRNQLAQAGVTINPSVGQSVAMLAPEHVNGIALARDERQAYQDQINKGVETALQAMMRKPAWAQASPEQRQQLVDTAIGSVTRREGLAVLRTVPQPEVETRLAVAKNGPAAAAYAWQHVPHYEGVGGTPAQIYQKNLSIEAAKATLARYAQIYKDPDVAEYHLAKDDPTAAKLAQYPDLDADYLSAKRAAIDKRFNGDLTKAERSGLVEVGLNAASTQ